MTCIAGAACVRSTYLKRTFKRRASMWLMDGMGRDGSVQDGTGIPGLADSRSCRLTDSSTVRLAGIFIPRWLFTECRLQSDLCPITLMGRVQRRQSATDFTTMLSTLKSASGAPTEQLKSDPPVSTLVTGR